MWILVQLVSAKLGHISRLSELSNGHWGGAGAVNVG